MKSKKLICILTLSTMIFQGSFMSGVHAQTVSTHRIAGQTRYDTSVAISQKGWNQSDTVILANGEKFADALCAGPLAKKYNAPILLLPSTTMENNTLNELARLQAKNIIIVGGTSSVSLNVENQLKSSGYTNIDRISGKDRYETSVMIAEKLDKTDKVIIASSEKFPDALSISAIASKLGIPIILSNKNALSEKAKQFIQTNNIKKTYIVGGEGVLSAAIEKSVPSPIRLSGDDRYGTNVAVMKEFEKDLNFDQVYLAMGDGETGDEFADALSGAVLASNTASPILLTYKSIDDTMNKYIKSKLNVNTKAIALGGQAVVPDKLVKTIMDEKSNISAAKIYSKAGTYSDGIINGSVIISESGVYLKNTTIEGDLLIGSTVGDGTVDLDNVTVKGKTIINGGGSRGINYHNGNGVNILIDKPLGEDVGIIADENTSINSVVIQSNSILNQSKAAKISKITVEQNVSLKLIGKFDNVEIKGQGASVDIENGSIDTLNVADLSKNAVINLDKNSKINKITLNAETDVKGEGSVENAFINVNGVTLEQKPTNLHIASGISAIVKGVKETGTKSVSSSGSGGRGSSVVLSKIVVSAASVPDIDVPTGTTLGAISLPQNVGIKLNDGSTTSAAITWDGGKPSYDGSVAGTYIFTGNITLTQGIINPDNKQASVKVVVGRNTGEIENKIVISVVPIPDINVATGTTLEAIGLSENVDVLLEDGSTTSAAVTWDSGNSSYDGNTLGTYEFTGIITLPKGVVNSKNKQASVKVIVVPKINTRFELPKGLAKDNKGNIYVTDMVNDKIQIFDSSGKLIKEWGAYGIYQGKFIYPSGIAVDSSGYIFVVDAANDRIQKFDSNGTFIKQWGGHGYDAGHFDIPKAIAIDSLDNVYVTEVGTNRIQKFNSDGEFLSEWGRWGWNNGEFENPEAITVDKLGNVYVADAVNNRIQKFDSNGTFLAKWGTSGSDDGQFNSPEAIAVDNTGDIYVTDVRNSRIQKFKADGTFLGKWGTFGCNSSEFNFPAGIVVDNSGNIYVADTINSRIQKFDSNTTFVEQWKPGDSGNCQFNYIEGIALDNSGNIYVTDVNKDNIQKFNSNGAFIRGWGSNYGVGNYRFDEPSGVAIDSLGNIYVVNSRINVVQKFDSNGNFIKQWGGYGYGDGQFDRPETITVDASGNVYVADTSNDRIQKFDSNGAFIKQWGSSGTGNGQFDGPIGVAVDNLGNVYVSDTENNRIQKFDSNGTFLGKWGSLGASNGKMYLPRGIAVDASGNVYVVDCGNSNVKKFDSNGAFIKKYGTLGSGNGQLYVPSGVAVDANGNIYVVDSGNKRIQIFTP